MFVAVTASGAQPVVLFRVNSGVNGGSIQIVFISVEDCAQPFLTVNLIVYVPATLNLIPKFSEPSFHPANWLGNPPSLPNVPLVNIQPLDGEISQYFLSLALHCVVETIDPLTDILLVLIV